MKTLVLAVTALTLATACSKKQSSSWSGGDTLQAKAARQSLLQGTWKGECENEDGKSSDAITTVDAKTYVAVSKSYDKENCEGDAASTLTSNCTYESELNADLEGTLSVNCVSDDPEIAAAGVTSVQAKSAIKISEANGETVMTIKPVSTSGVVNGKIIDVAAGDKVYSAKKVK